MLIFIYFKFFLLDKKVTFFLVFMVRCLFAAIFM